MFLFKPMTICGFYFFHYERNNVYTISKIPIWPQDKKPIMVCTNWFLLLNLLKTFPLKKTYVSCLMFISEWIISTIKWNNFWDLFLKCTNMSLYSLDQNYNCLIYWTVLIFIHQSSIHVSYPEDFIKSNHTLVTEQTYLYLDKLVW